MIWTSCAKRLNSFKGAAPLWNPRAAGVASIQMRHLFGVDLVVDVMNVNTFDLENGSKFHFNTT